MATSPVTSCSVAHRWAIDAGNFRRNYKEVLSGFNEWNQKEHAAEWILLPKNCGTRLSIDETSLHDDLFTILSNKEGHGKSGTIVAMVRGTKASEVIARLMELPQEQRLAVAEVTMNFSDSMMRIVRVVFPNATIIIDCFHIIKRCGEAMEEIRLKEKRNAVKEQNKAKAEHKKKLEQLVKTRKSYRKKHPKTYKGKKRGRKPCRLSKKFVPEELSNGDTKIELLTRSRGLLSKSRDKWSPTQKARAKLLFELYPKIKEAYNLVDSLRAIFRNKTIDRNQAGTKLHEWYQKVADSTLREVKSARDSIREKEDEVLNYFINRSTNAAAESLNSKIKHFRSQLHGVSDLPFFIYRLTVIFG